MRLKLTIAYVGTSFCGWQFQKNKRTIQSELEIAFSKLYQTQIKIFGAGRTDAGVHAIAQIAHVDVPNNKNISLPTAINAFLPTDIAVTSAEPVNDDFHARFSAKTKIYSYRFWTIHNYILPQREQFVYPVGNLNIEKMEQASKFLIGKHDFASFQNKGTIVKSTVRTIYEINFLLENNSRELVIYFFGNGFLKQMIRNICGTLTAVGKNKFKPEYVINILEAKTRSIAPSTAPAKGLCLEKIIY